MTFVTSKLGLDFNPNISVPGKKPFSTSQMGTRILFFQSVPNILSKPDSNIDLGVEEGDRPKGQNTKNSEPCPIDIPCDGIGES